MNIRIAESTDPDVIAPLNEPVQEEHQERRPDWFKPYNAEVVREFVETMVDRADARFLVAYVDENPAGYVLLLTQNRQESTLRFADRSLTIDQMSVNPEFRRLGVGDALMKHVREIARDESFDRIRLTVWSDNESAIAFYEQMGFKTFRETMELPLD
jgi:diamine N-acetyltransferase